jgi:hypothetical protein
MGTDSHYFFPEAPAGGLCEWPGSPIGASNVITRTKGRTACHNKTVDATPGLLDRLLKSARDHMERIVGEEGLFQHDVIIHGVRVRATTNSPHLYDFWVENWYSHDEWLEATGQKPPTEPRIKVYAMLGVADQPEAAYYSHHSNTIIFFNTSYYGQLKSWVLGGVGRILAAEYGIHSIHGACVEMGGKGVLYIAPTGTGKSTSSYGLMSYPETRFHSDDWVYVRYAYAARDGRRLLVLEAEGSDGSRARGYQVHGWLESHASDSAARLLALTLDNRELTLTLGELDLEKPLEAYAYTSEKVFYLRTNLVENYPLAACQILASKQENVPDVSLEHVHDRQEVLEEILGDLAAARSGSRCSPLRGKSDAEVGTLFARLIAFDNARSMLDMAQVLPAGRVYTHPLEPVRVAAVMLLKRNAEDATVLADLSLDAFMERLLIGETPAKKREIAYNAYRAVDDAAESACIQSLEKQAAASPDGSLYRHFARAADKPDSLLEEFELFRAMHRAARCYDLNTTLEKDPGVSSKRQAVERTMRIIARTLREEPRGVHLTLENYGAYIG